MAFGATTQPLTPLTVICVSARKGLCLARAGSRRLPLSATLVHTRKGSNMQKYSVWVRVNRDMTTFTFVWASSGYEARRIAEAQYGVGNVIDWSLVSED